MKFLTKSITITFLSNNFMLRLSRHFGYPSKSMKTDFFLGATSCGDYGDSSNFQINVSISFFYATISCNDYRSASIPRWIQGHFKLLTKSINITFPKQQSHVVVIGHFKFQSKNIKVTFLPIICCGDYRDT